MNYEMGESCEINHKKHISHKEDAACFVSLVFSVV